MVLSVYSQGHEEIKVEKEHYNVFRLQNAAV